MEQHQQQMASTNTNHGSQMSYNDSIRNAHQVLNTSAIDDLVDELS
jgi:hypothetical protein